MSTAHQLRNTGVNQRFSTGGPWRACHIFFGGQPQFILKHSMLQKVLKKSSVGHLKYIRIEKHPTSFILVQIKADLN